MEPNYKELNILNWYDEDENFNSYSIYGFGKDMNGESHSIKVYGFRPEMYIRIREKDIDIDKNNDFMKELEEDSSRLSKLIDTLDFIASKSVKCKSFKEKENELEKDEELEFDSDDDNVNCCLAHMKLADCKQDILKNRPDLYDTRKCSIIKKYCKILNKKDLYESYGNNDIVVLKLVFKTKLALSRLNKALKPIMSSFNGNATLNKYLKLDGKDICKSNYIIDTYKSDLPPLLDFFHNRDIQPCGWIKFDKFEFKNDIYNINFKDIESVNKFEFAPFKIMSWDIEADSSHGDFPVAKKTYKKLAMDICDFYLNYISKNKNVEKVLLKKIFRYSLNIAFKLNNDIELDTKIKSMIESDINIIYLKKKLSDSNINLLTSKSFIKTIYEICDKNKSKSITTGGVSQMDRLFLDKKDLSDDYDNDDNNNETKKLSNRDIIILKLTNLFSEELPEVCGDRVIQIGCVFHHFGTKNNTKHILTLGSCDKFDDDTTIYEYANDKNINDYSVNELNIEERKLIIEFQDLIKREQPDILMTYNGFGFDNKFLFERADELNMDYNFGYLGRLNKQSKIKIKNLSSAALGDNIFHLIDNMIGITELDLLQIIKRDHNLDSYSLNNVSDIFIGDAKDDVTPKQIFEYQRQSSDKRAIIAKYCIKDCVLLVDLMNKLDILSANMGMANVCSVPLEYIILRGQGIKIQSLVSKECNIENYILRELEKGGSDSSYEGAIVLPPVKGMYLEEPVSVLDYASLYPSSMIASNISHEGIVKTEVFEGKDANLEEIEEINLYNIQSGIEFRHYKKYIKDNLEEFQEEIKQYNKYPLLDSIYLTTIQKRYIRKCKSTLYTTLKYKQNKKNIKDIKKFKEQCLEEYRKLSEKEKEQYCINVYYPYNKNLDDLNKYENMDNVNYIKICFDTYKGKGDKKEKFGVKRITFAHPCGIEQHDDVNEYPDQTISKRGIMPKILRKLLKARKDTRKKIPLEKDEFKKGVLEGLQLGYKLSANSLYGQTGASTSAIFKQDVAAATTSTGRQMLMLCSSFSKQYYGCDIVYGDTDSVFIKYKECKEDGKNLEGKERLRFSIQKSINLQNEIRTVLRRPHDLEYEKSFFPFILFSKKRYIGYLYEDDWNITPKLKYMGIVLKRRDNANIVKIFYKGIITRLLEDKTIDSAIVFLKEKLQELIDGKFAMEDLTITKTLRGYYKTPDSIAHKVLADRMKERDPGSAPASNDRVPYVYINVKEKKGVKLLQGDRVEHPDFIRENNLKINYKFYITNQLMKPIMQIFELCLKKPDEPFLDALNRLERENSGVRDISSYFK